MLNLKMTCWLWTTD